MPYRYFQNGKPIRAAVEVQNQDVTVLVLDGCGRPIIADDGIAQLRRLEGGIETRAVTVEQAKLIDHGLRETSEG